MFQNSIVYIEIDGGYIQYVHRVRINIECLATASQLYRLRLIHLALSD